MKILYLTNHLLGKDGVSVNAIHTIEPVAQAGHDCVVLVNIINPEKKIQQKPVLRKHLAYINNPLYILVDFFKILAVVREEKPEIIHFLAEPYAVFLPLLHIFVRCRYVLTICGTYAVVPYRRLRTRLLALWYYRLVDSIISISAYTASRLWHILPKTKLKTQVIPCGIDLTSFSLSPADPKVTNDLVSIVFIGWIKERKGVLESLKVLTEYKKIHGDNVRFSIIGRYDVKDRYWQKINTYIDEAGIRNNVEFCGLMEEEEKQKKLKSADLFIMLSKVDGDYFEGFGLVYIESNAYGIPVIGPNVGGPTQAIKDGFSGYVVNAENPTEVAKKMYEVIDERRIRPKNCIQWAKEHNREKIIFQYLSEYKKILGV